MSDKPWYVVYASSGDAATFFLRGPDTGKPVPFKTREEAQENADFLQGDGGFYRAGRLTVSQSIPGESSVESWLANR